MPVHKDDIELYLQKLSYRLSSDVDVQNEKNKRAFLSQNLESSFIKYEIIDTLEHIIETNTVRPNSLLAKEPKKTIKTFVKTYEKKRKRALRLLDTKIDLC